MKKLVVLGSGMVGRAMALDLSHDHEVTVADVDQVALDSIKEENNQIKVIQADLSNQARVQSLVAEADLVVGSVPGYMGYKTAETVIEAGKDIVDIAFFDENPFGLDELAKSKGVTAVVDCGVAPGMSNMIIGYHDAHMDVDDFECLVGGLPFNRTWPFEYKAPFSPIDVIEEYIRPARIVQDGKVVERPALSEPELVNFDTIGTLEAFNTDGLRSLIETMDIPNMKEKTMRFPGHIAYMRVLREMGLFSKEPIDVDGHMIRPLDMTTKLMFPMWKLEPDEEEFTVMRIRIQGKENGEEKTYQYDLFDMFDPETQVSSMARTTGYACTAVVNLVLDGHYTQKGISPPEYIGKVDGCLEKVLEYMEDRDIFYEKTVE